MRQQILLIAVAEILFEKKVVDFKMNDDSMSAVTTADGTNFDADAVILATGHSARDIFQIALFKKNKN